MTYSKELQQKMKMLDKVILILLCIMSQNGQTHFKNLAAFASWPYLGTANRVPPRKELQEYMKIFQFNRSRFMKFFLSNIHSQRNKTDMN